MHLYRRTYQLSKVSKGAYLGKVYSNRGYRFLMKDGVRMGVPGFQFHLDITFTIAKVK